MSKRKQEISMSSEMQSLTIAISCIEKRLCELTKKDPSRKRQSVVLERASLEISLRGLERLLEHLDENYPQ